MGTVRDLGLLMLRVGVSAFPASATGPELFGGGGGGGLGGDESMGFEPASATSTAGVGDVGGRCWLWVPPAVGAARPGDRLGRPNGFFNTNGG